MGTWLEDVYQEQGWNAGLVVPVPLNKHRRQRRGFNQAELLADAFGRRAGLTVDSGRLIRVEDTRSQVGLNPHERWHNVRDAFIAKAQSFDNEDVLIVDDLFTTGATLSACARAIKAAGARSVVGLAVARA